MKRSSSWSEVKPTKTYPPLKTNLTVDVAIIGGGITGVLSAYLLSKQGKRVVVIEKDTIGSGATQQTTAFITQDIGFCNKLVTGSRVS